MKHYPGTNLKSRWQTHLGHESLLGLGGRVARSTALFTTSGVYMRPFRLTLTTRMVRAPWRGWSRSWFFLLNDRDSCWRYWSGTNSSKRNTVEEVLGLAPPETVDLVKGRDLNSIYGGETGQGGHHKSRGQRHLPDLPILFPSIHRRTSGHRIHLWTFPRPFLCP